MAESVFRVALRPGISRLKLVSLFVCHGLAIAGCANSGLSGYLAVALAYAVLVHLCVAIRTEVRLNAPQRVVSLAGDGEHFELTLGDGSKRQGQRQGRCCVTTWLLVLCVQSRTGRRFHISVFKDSVAAPAFRRAAVALRFSG
ncbi:MAG: hypothetical protein HOL98_11255 [Gammaproteobacteria bacterium]|nr:hypothetical protein [Gammaproteobacteria bacterium]MBT5204021.1 hypothetical protein [Gammaproteobacteria bacterium]MBT5602725.1 hypothetical protein [Gammaproteobacteria bacterium]MBT6243843.1 hypothetical protein [Gammaproteobacteria bacterium]